MLGSAAVFAAPQPMHALATGSTLSGMYIYAGRRTVLRTQTLCHHESGGGAKGGLSTTTRSFAWVMFTDPVPRLFHTIASWLGNRWLSECLGAFKGHAARCMYMPAACPGLICHVFYLHLFCGPGWLIPKLGCLGCSPDTWATKAWWPPLCQWRWAGGCA